MPDIAAIALFAGVLVVALTIVHKPLGDHMYRVLTRVRHTRVERVVHRVVGVNADTEQTWGGYARSVLAFTGISVVFLFVFQRLQGFLPLNNGHDGVAAPSAWNTAVSFATNTNWQSYSAETTMGHLVQMAGLAVQNFTSAAVGIAVAIVLVRGFARTGTDRLGNFWVDLLRVIIWVLLPLSALAAVVLMLGGVAQNLGAETTAETLNGSAQTIPGGPVAGQEAIKHLGTNGGGFYAAGSAHPFENPTGWTNLLQIFLLLCVPFSLPRTFGRIVGDNRQGHAVTAVMATLAILSTALVVSLESRGAGTVPSAIGAAMEGRETRFGVGDSGVFAAATTLTSTGSVDSAHDSYTALGGGALMVNMMLGEVAPGGAGSGLYGLLVLAVITVFIAGLMVGRTPEYLGKKIASREIKLAGLYFLVTPVVLLAGFGLSIALPFNRAAMPQPGPHGLSELLYAFTSATANNGSAFAGLTADTPWLDTALGLCMLLGRLLPIVLVLALAGSLATQRAVPISAGTFPTHRPLFVGMVIVVTIVLAGLTFLPVLALGPLAEGL